MTRFALHTPRPSHSTPVFHAVLVGFVLFAGLPASAATLHAQQSRIVFLAGPKDHGVPGRHEYERDLRALAWSLENASNLDGVTTEVRIGKAPRNLDEIRDASVIVIHCSGDWLANETHVLFPQHQATDGRTYDPDTEAYLEQFDDLLESGVGLVILHYALWADNWVARSHYMDWIGGLWLTRGSQNPVDEWTMTPIDTDHPALRGVQPWTYRDEVYTRFLLPNDPRRTDLMLGTPATRPIGPEVVGWAYDRFDGGRSFVFGGSDFNDNMYSVDDYRRFLLNGIVWAAGMDVPAGGVMAPAPPAE